MSSPTVPDIHCVLHDSHICLALGRRVDGQLSWRNDKAFAKWQPHAFSKSVCESETQKGKVNISETSHHVTKKNIFYIIQPVTGCCIVRQATLRDKKIGIWMTVVLQFKKRK